MRAPVPSFKNELAAFRACRHPNSADMALMDRWLSDERAEECWNKIKRTAPALPPAEFVQAVLKARRSAAASVNRTFGAPLPRGAKLPGFNAEWLELLPVLKKRITYRLSRSPSAITPIETAEFLEDAAREIRMLHQSHFGFSDQVEFSLIREGSNNDRSRVAFYRLTSDYLQKHCQERLYEEISFLTEIAFPGKEIDAEAVRDALRPRKSKKLKPMRR